MNMTEDAGTVNLEKSAGAAVQERSQLQVIIQVKNHIAYMNQKLPPRGDSEAISRWLIAKRQRGPCPLWNGGLGVILREETHEKKQP